METRPMQRDLGGIRTVADLKAKCKVDPLTGCWLWQHSVAKDGVPRIWAFDHTLGRRHVMSGPKAVWNIAHGCAPLPGWLVFRRCVCKACVNPVHMAEARSKAEICLHIRRSGRRKGTAMASRAANAKKAREACGIVDTPLDVRAKLVAAPRSVSNVDLAAQYGISTSLVSRWRCQARRAAEQLEAA